MQVEDSLNDRSLRKLHSDRPRFTRQFEKYPVAWESDREREIRFIRDQVLQFRTMSLVSCGYSSDANS